MTDLQRNCERFGIAMSYRDAWGKDRPVPEATLHTLLEILEGSGEPSPLPPSTDSPLRCFRPPVLENGGRIWGPAVQLYALRSERNWGIGDFSDLLRLVEHWGACGADVIGVNPLHALFPEDPGRASPYGPSSRIALNVLYLDVEAIEEFQSSRAARSHVASPEFRETLAHLRDAPLVDYPGVAAAKFEVLQRLYARFREEHLRHDTARARAFRDFVQDAGEPLLQHARQEAAPNRTRSAIAPPAERVEYFLYLQWQAEVQLARVSARCKELGLALGLYLDVALSVDGAGSDASTNRDVYALDASIGAPPDTYNLKGQDWGLPPPAPTALRASGYALFARALGAAMRFAGAIRLDHAMQLERLFWIPRGAAPSDGAYVRYERDEMLAVLARESQRHRCVVVCEDLGTVPEGFGAALERAGALVYRILYFERDAGGGFKPAAEYPRNALVAASNHDLPTLAGWWTGNDLEWRERLGLFSTPSLRDAQFEERAADRTRLAQALGISAPDALPDAAHAFLARTPSFMLLVQLEDVLGEREQANLPGTVLQHPNWRRKLSATLEKMEQDPRVAQLCESLSQVRS